MRPEAVAVAAALVGVLGTLGAQWLAARVQLRIEDRRREHEQRLRVLERDDDKAAMHRAELRDIYLRYLTAINQLRRQVLALRRLAPEGTWWGPTDGREWRAAQDDLFTVLGRCWATHEEILLVSTAQIYDFVHGRVPRYPRQPQGESRPHPGAVELTQYADDLDAYINAVRLLMRSDVGYAPSAGSRPAEHPAPPAAPGEAVARNAR